MGPAGIGSIITLKSIWIHAFILFEFTGCFDNLRGNGRKLSWIFFAHQDIFQKMQTVHFAQIFWSSYFHSSINEIQTFYLRFLLWSLNRNEMVALNTYRYMYDRPKPMLWYRPCFRTSQWNWSVCSHVLCAALDKRSISNSSFWIIAIITFWY